jgi:hypothetical protein
MRTGIRGIMGAKEEDKERGRKRERVKLGKEDRDKKQCICG